MIAKQYRITITDLGNTADQVGEQTVYLRMVTTDNINPITDAIAAEVRNIETAPATKIKKTRRDKGTKRTKPEPAETTGALALV